MLADLGPCAEDHFLGRQATQVQRREQAFLGKVHHPSRTKGRAPRAEAARFRRFPVSRANLDVSRNCDAGLAFIPETQVVPPVWPIKPGGGCNAARTSCISPGEDWDNQTGRPPESDEGRPERLDPVGLILECSKQDGLSLSTTASTPNIRPRATAKRAASRHRLDPGTPAEEGTRPTRLGKTLGMVMLAGLLGLTSWVVASVSTWLVPVYVTAMALIFVIPRAERPQGSGPLGDKGEPDLDKDQGGEAAGLSSLDPDPRDAVVQTANPPAEASASVTDGSGPGTAKPKRARSRGRKPPAKPGAEPAPGTAAATWIRVGPGKFVRADSDPQRQDVLPSSEPGQLAQTGASSDIPSPVETPGPSANPEPGSPATDLMPEAEAAREDSDSLEPTVAREDSDPLELTAASEINPVDPGNSLDPQPDAEEYGIAPSAFGPDVVEVEDASEKDSHQDFAELLVCPESGAENLAETETKVQTDAESARSRNSGNPWLGVGLRSTSRWKLLTRRFSGSGVSRLVRNVRSGSGRRGLAQPRERGEFTPALTGMAEPRPLRAKPP